MEVFDHALSQLERSMTISTKRQAVIAQNIANAKTAGYEAMEFDEQLMKAVKRQENKDVILEDELSALTDNSVKYSSYVRLMSSKIAILKSIASQGRK
ncbi:MAG: flagellar basal body protein [Candidatus Margulisbacteria bacterium]|nr:flagellar basal body protein [Candidatus Margulisiibacteriota bacterium]MBU1616337.1 flagellar basal body protein [Candidatus Margulisiibacteriota bacterium]MBU1867441.1 flagellar basal body protein [Candidatus Margulisiibacteriota bacterium]